MQKTVQFNMQLTQKENTEISGHSQGLSNNHGQLISRSLKCRKKNKKKQKIKMAQLTTKI